MWRRAAGGRLGASSNSQDFDEAFGRIPVLAERQQEAQDVSARPEGSQEASNDETMGILAELIDTKLNSNEEEKDNDVDDIPELAPRLPEGDNSESLSDDESDDDRPLALLRRTSRGPPVQRVTRLQVQEPEPQEDEEKQDENDAELEEETAAVPQADAAVDFAMDDIRDNIVGGGTYTGYLADITKFLRWIAAEKPDWHTYHLTHVLEQIKPEKRETGEKKRPFNRRMKELLKNHYRIGTTSTTPQCFV